MPIALRNEQASLPIPQRYGVFILKPNRGQLPDRHHELTTAVVDPCLPLASQILREKLTLVRLASAVPKLTALTPRR